MECLTAFNDALCNFLFIVKRLNNLGVDTESISLCCDFLALETANGLIIVTNRFSHRTPHRRQRCKNDNTMAEVLFVDVEKLSVAMATSVSNRSGDRDTSAVQRLAGADPKPGDARHFPRPADFPSAAAVEH